MGHIGGRMERLLLLSVLLNHVNGLAIDPIGELYKQNNSIPQNITLHHYHSHKQMMDLMTALDEKEFVTKFRIGKSVDGREIDGLRFTGISRSERPLLKPMVKFVGNMHGDEAVGRELLLGLATYLTMRYDKDERITNLLDHVEVHLVPTMNPDGFEREERHNRNGKDLNRNFPTWQDLNSSRAELKVGREVETTAMMDYIMDNPFVLSINFHDGAVVANFPWDDSSVRPAEKSNLFVTNGNSSRTPDNDVFEMLARQYSSKHQTMKASGASCVDRYQFKDGITNGVEWYVVTGGMQDFNYLFSNCMEITVELSCIKKPDASRLQKEWDNNLESLLTFLEEARRVLRGLVTDENGNVVAGAQIRVEGIGKHVTSSNRGEYWRVLLPGRYKIQAVGNGKESEVVEVVVGDEKEPRLDLRLQKDEETTVKPPAAAAEEGLKLDLVPGWCLHLVLFRLPKWC